MFEEKDQLGNKTYAVDKTYFHKIDDVKEYTEVYLKVSNMSRRK